MRLFTILRGSLTALLLLAGAAHAAPSCEDVFYQKQQPVIESTLLVEKAKDLCFEGFAAGHSGLFRAPLWVAERLTRESLADARRVDRKDEFHPDRRLARSERAELRDYSRSGYDRGHMAPAADMPSKTSQRDSFSLANIVPQHPDNNQGIWADIEETVRRMVDAHGEAYVVTGPIYSSRYARRIGRVAVPDGLYKAVFLPGKGAAVYVTDNAADSDVRTYSVLQAEEALHIDLFPGMPTDVKQEKMELPEPIRRSHRRGSRRS